MATVTVTRDTTAQTAKRVRAALKEAFPGTKFSVRSQNYSGGSSISVRWTDGPSTEAVREVTQCFRGADFDGMIDLKTRRDPTLFANEDGTFEEVRYGADYILESRDISREYREEAAAKIAALTGEACDLTLWGDDGEKRNGAGWEQRYEACVVDGELCRYAGLTYGRDLYYGLTQGARP